MDESEIGMIRNQEREEEEEDAELGIDKLSSLPDSILIHILSFLDTASAIKTSVLSKRFELLWTLLPCLDFRFCGCFNDRFLLFVKNVLARREHCNLRIFRLSLERSVDSTFIDNCIAYAAKHKVENLRIRAFTRGPSSSTLPRLLLNSSFLTNLRLNNVICSSLILPKSLAFPVLKVLQLKNFVFSDKTYDGDLFSGCPVLETLILNKCWFRPNENIKVFDVNCLKLKNLEIRHWRIQWRYFFEHMINVNAPMLRSFKFRGHIVEVNFKENLSCLDQVWADLHYPTACALIDVNERRRRTLESFINMLGKLCNVKSLILSQSTVEVLSSIPYLQQCGNLTFDNLRYIKITVEDKLTDLRIPINSLAPSMKCVYPSIYIFEVSVQHQIFVKVNYSKIRITCKDVEIAIPVHVMTYLLESSPSVEFLIVEFPKV